MIALSINVLIILITLITLPLLLLFWLYDERKHRKIKIVPNRIITINCDICMSKVNCERDEKFIRCPVCSSLIKIK